MTTHSTRGICLPARNTRFSTASTRFSDRTTRLSTCGTRLSTRSSRLSTGSICLSARGARSNICRSFYSWSVIKRPTDSTTSTTSGQTDTMSGHKNPHFNDLNF